MEEEDGLQKLVGAWRGELREKNLAGRALADFKMIQALRLQKCPWHRIAGAMGVNPDSLRKLYLWTLAEVEAGRLEPPDAPPPRQAQEGISAAAAKGDTQPQERKGFKRIDLDKLDKQEGEQHGT